MISIRLVRVLTKDDPAPWLGAGGGRRGLNKIVLGRDKQQEYEAWGNKE